MKKRMIPLLALCLLLTACGMREEEEMPQRADDMEILLTVDGREVPRWRYLCWLAYACDRVEEQYRAAGQTVDWDLAVEGGTLADHVKEQALADTVLYATVENWAERYGCAEAGGDAPKELPLKGLSEEQKQELWQVGRQYASLYDLYRTEGSALAPLQEELDAFAQERGGMVLNRILIAAGADREAAKQRAAEVFSRLNSAENPAEIFAVLAAEGDDPAGPRSEQSCDWEESLLTAARSLAAGQYSGILESSEGFSVLMRMRPEEETLREEHFDSLLQAAADSAAVMVRPAYYELKPEEFADGAGGDLR